jgi:putative chitinase
MVEVGGTFLAAVAPRFSGAKALRQRLVLDAIGPLYAEALAAHSIDTELRVAHFTAQVAHESAGFRETEEFASGAAYENRIDLGNLRAGDGPRFKGRGLIQLTGRANYRRFGERLALPLEDEPELAAVPAIALNVACAYWSERAINGFADADRLEAVTRRVNGGLNGLEDRRFYLERAKRALELQEPSAETTLRRGAKGREVGRLQRLLGRQGFPLALDASFGPTTERAVARFQERAGLKPDGIVGPRTWAALAN